MRVLFMISIMVVSFAFNIFAQTNFAEDNFNKGTELAKSGKYKNAIAHYRKSLETVGEDKKLKSKINYNIGSCFYQLKDFKAAEKSFKKAIKLGKNRYVQAIYSLGLAQIELKKIRSAEANFRKVIRLDEKHGEAWFDLGMVLLQRKMFKNARIAFQKSIENKTTRLAEAQNNLGVVSAVQGRIKLAQSQFQLAFFLSKGKLLLAKANFEYCKSYRIGDESKILARLRSTRMNPRHYGQTE